MNSDRQNQAMKAIMPLIHGEMLIKGHLKCSDSLENVFLNGPMPRIIFCGNSSCDINHILSFSKYWPSLIVAYSNRLM